MKTYYYKGHNGHKMETSKELPNGKTLKLATYKSGGNLSTYASVGISTDNTFTTMLFQDFMKKVISEKVRVTEKAVRAQHHQALNQLDELEAEIAEYYSNEMA